MSPVSNQPRPTPLIAAFRLASFSLRSARPFCCPKAVPGPQGALMGLWNPLVCGVSLWEQPPAAAPALVPPMLAPVQIAARSNAAIGKPIKKQKPPPSRVKAVVTATVAPGIDDWLQQLLDTSRAGRWAGVGPLRPCVHAAGACRGQRAINHDRLHPSSACVVGYSRMLGSGHRPWCSRAQGARQRHVAAPADPPCSTTPPALTRSFFSACPLHKDMKKSEVRAPTNPQQ